MAGSVGISTEGFVNVLGDKPNSQQMAQEAKPTEASKHIVIYYYFVSEMVDHGDFTLPYVPSQVNAADILAKGLGGQQHVTLAGRKGIGNCGDVEDVEI